MNDITLGKCPFCGGRVSSTVESGHEGALVAYWCVRPVCENGCPVGRVADGWDDLHVGYGGDPGPDVVGADLAAKWAGGHDPARAGRQVERRGGRGRERRKTPGRTGGGMRDSEPRLLARSV